MRALAECLKGSTVKVSHAHLAMVEHLREVISEVTYAPGYCNTHITTTEQSQFQSTHPQGNFTIIPCLTHAFMMHS